MYSIEQATTEFQNAYLQNIRKEFDLGDLNPKMNNRQNNMTMIMNILLNAWIQV